VSRYTAAYDRPSELAIAILFDDLRRVADLRHASPNFPHGVEDPRFFACRHARWSGEGAQFRDRLAAAFDHDHATFRGLAHKLRSVDVEFTDRGFVVLELSRLFGIIIRVFSEPGARPSLVCRSSSSSSSPQCRGTRDSLISFRSVSGSKRRPSIALQYSVSKTV
jgi:hypothetical protein